MNSGSSSIGQSTTVVISGGPGDLTRRKLIPSLCSLFCKGRLGPEVNIVGMARSNISTEEFDQFLSRAHYHFGDVSLNDLGLLSEEFDSATRKMLGNFSQAFSHLAMINTAVQSQKASGGPPSGTDRA